jgi:hypothetical protein
MQLIQRATACDVARIVVIARAAYIKYVPRIGREPPPMLADFAAEIAAGHVVVLEIGGTVEGYLISWPKMDAYFVDNIAVDPVKSFVRPISKRSNPRPRGRLTSIHYTKRLL